MKNKVIAIDFDGTLFTDNWPGIGEPIYQVIYAAMEEQKRGAKLILWTMREGLLLGYAVEACANVGLEFDAVNDNLKKMKDRYGNNPRKVYADEYWDDHNAVPRNCSPGIYAAVQKRKEYTGLMLEWTYKQRDDSYERWKEKAIKAKYTISMNEMQARVLAMATEEYMRVRMGQFEDLAQELSRAGYVYKQDDPENRKKFAEWMARRDKVEEITRQIVPAAWGTDYVQSLEPTVQVAGDIWRTLRQNIARTESPLGGDGVDFAPVFRIGAEPLPEMTVEVET